MKMKTRIKKKYPDLPTGVFFCPPGGQETIYHLRVAFYQKALLYNEIIFGGARRHYSLLCSLMQHIYVLCIMHIFVHSNNLA